MWPTPPSRVGPKRSNSPGEVRSKQSNFSWAVRPKHKDARSAPLEAARSYNLIQNYRYVSSCIVQPLGDGDDDCDATVT
eukprot:3896318-Pyramimonas_sp.AAC.1